jgi:hypothetical protein
MIGVPQDGVGTYVAEVLSGIRSALYDPGLMYHQSDHSLLKRIFTGCYASMKLWKPATVRQDDQRKDLMAQRVSLAMIR